MRTGAAFIFTAHYNTVMDYRICKICGEEKPLNEFARAGLIKGVVYFRYKCIPCYSKFKGIRKAAIRDKYYDLKKDLKCCQCGNTDFRVLEFDHKDRKEKSFSVAEGLKRGYSLAKLKSEIEKCQVLCANCHRIKTFEEGIGV